MPLQINITSQELWEEMLCLKGLIVVDVFQAWCGPCKPVVNLFQKIRNQVGSDLLHFAVVLELTCELAVPLLLTSVILPPKSGTQRCFPVWGAEVDSIDALEKYRGQCEPVFLFYTGGELVAVVRGADAPLLQKTILKHLAGERKSLHGGEPVVVPDRAFSREQGSTAPLQEEQQEGLTVLHPGPVHTKSEAPECGNQRKTLLALAEAPWDEGA
ncbi:thioredoxin domain-containing protein 6 isoform X2 [Hirundo rustica]|uniref:thioredoxin domain-containing protein 6 isoform X2 n=1 Tax=Hirundo rustica TaxID=43150 RepID=UPI001A940386|nr:thioredoxin domain-containing protein 6 isoform X2 [Hirundo rustica]